MVNHLKIGNKQINYCLSILLTIVPALAQAQIKVDPAPFPAAKLINTEQRPLQSNIVNQDYEIYVSLPDNYANEDKIYPVLYLTDANTYFGLMADMARGLQGGREMPETIVVDIGYPIREFPTYDERCRAHP